MANKANSIDILIRPPISSITDRSVTKEIPKSPWGKPTIKFINCIGRGSSSPRRVLSLRTCSGVTSPNSPIILFSTGSPGTTRTRKKTSMATAVRVGKTNNKRLAVYLNIFLICLNVYACDRVPGRKFIQGRNQI